MSYSSVADVLARLDREAGRQADPLYLAIGSLRLEVRAAEPLRAELAGYFAHVLATPGPVAATIEVLEGQGLDPAPDWVDWAREPGKAGRKDAICDLADGRLVHKVRTGLSFLQSGGAVLCFGPAAAHPNQVINFINSQVLNIGQRAGWVLCHAAAITDGARSLAIAGLSGGGKSTSILRLMDMDGLAFVSNDRVLVKGGDPVAAMGIAKHPRINPGTILGNPRLHAMVSDADLVRWRDMPRDALWALEDKHDLIVPDVYGPGRLRHDARLTDFWVLNWARDAAAPMQVTPFDPAERPDLLAAIMKSPGPFYCDAQGRFARDDDALDAQAYLAALDNVRMAEVTGRVDFDAIAAAGRGVFAG